MPLLSYPYLMILRQDIYLNKVAGFIIGVNYLPTGMVSYFLSFKSSYEKSRNFPPGDITDEIIPWPLYFMEIALPLRSLIDVRFPDCHICR